MQMFQWPISEMSAVGSVFTAHNFEVELQVEIVPVNIQQELIHRQNIIFV